ncbi:hypothetical protein GLAREA_11794 [Glarea lozoyensis ATCC 20868]|uniref:Delta(14)-sterol reductase n=1 Tax=Glarea lozoyensis (strain ATCC 20868 / MF5171) TaxID=1116229 RepID=S3DEY2_GLAL2|nr:uncharacterized protein GLAREA_11794 [Glarea lozoyensis ATCC 20868]EPE25213.1 hypothetical protein GLAREA_11794 [Glarea lozoyensis ATCC 20868]
MSEKKFPSSFLPRGDAAKRPSPLGTAVFVGLRTVDIFIQYGILANHLASPLLDLIGVEHISSFESPGPAAVAFGLPLKPLIILGMAVGTAIKQNYWVLSLSNEEMPVGNAISISLFNTIFNSVNTILSLTAASHYLTGSSFWENPIEVTPLFLFFTATYTAGTLVEVGAEIQRKYFKQDPKNKGKPFTGGLFGLARHINYGAYTVMRASYAFACGGWVPGILVAGFFGYDFARRGIPVLDDYCSKRYGDDWKKYKQEVKWQLLPGIY